MKHSWKWNSSSSTLFIEFALIHFAFHSLLQAKIAVPMQNEVVHLTSKQIQSFPGKKPHFQSSLPLFKLPSLPLGLPPQRVTFQYLQRFRFLFWPLRFSNHSLWAFYILTSNRWVLLCPFLLRFLALSFSAFCLPCDRAGSGPTKLSLSPWSL